MNKSILSFIILFSLSYNAVANDLDKTNDVSITSSPSGDKSIPIGVIVDEKIPLEKRQEMIISKELLLVEKEKQLNEKEKKLNDKELYLEDTRKRLVAQALDVKAALLNREKEIQQKAALAKVKPKKTNIKELSDFINEINKINPISD